MERLASCSKILYDKDLLDKSKEIRQAKEIMLAFETPKKIYPNFSEWKTIKQKTFKIVEESIIKCFLHRDDVFVTMRDNNMALTEDQEIVLQTGIENALKYVSHNPVWSNRISSDIIISIKALFEGLKGAFIWGIQLGGGFPNENDKCIPYMLYRFIRYMSKRIQDNDDMNYVQPAFKIIQNLKEGWEGIPQDVRY